MISRAAIAGLLLLAASVASAQAPVVLQYNPTLGDVQKSAFSAKLENIQLNGAPIPYGLDASGTITVEVIAVDEEAGTCTERVTVSDLLVDMGGQQQQPAPSAPADVTLDRQGRVVSIEITGEAEETEAVGIDSMTARLVPAMGMLATFPQFPADGVNVGDTWTLEEDRELPVAGNTRVVTENTLADVADGVATLSTSFNSDLPPFEMENPFLEGPMQVTGGKVSATDIQREWDTARSQVTGAKGAVTIELVADIGFGLPTPIAVTANFELVPAETPEEEGDEAVG